MCVFFFFFFVIGGEPRNYVAGGESVACLGYALWPGEDVLVQRYSDGAFCLLLDCELRYSFSFETGRGMIHP